MKPSLTIFILLYSFLILDDVFTEKSIFDSVEWELIKNEKNISLFMHYDALRILNYYRAETCIENKKGLDFFYNLIDFDKYPIMFPRTLLMKKVASGRNVYYVLLNFCPFKNRDYYVVMMQHMIDSQAGKEYILEWKPADSICEMPGENKNCLRLDLVYGRWRIVEKGSKTIISVEYLNDFKLNIPRPVLFEFEKKEIINALKNLLKYTLIKKTDFMP